MVGRRFASGPGSRKSARTLRLTVQLRAAQSVLTADRYAEAMGTLARVAYEMAASGKYPVMTIFWLKVHQGQPEDPMADGDWGADRAYDAKPSIRTRLAPLTEEIASS